MGRLPILQKHGTRSCFTWRTKEASAELPMEHAFYREYRIYWIFMKLIGLLPYHVDRDGSIKMNLFSKEMLYSVIAYVLLSVPVCLSMRLRCIRLFLSAGDFDSKVFTYMMAGLMIPHFTIPCSHWKYCKNHESVFRIWHQFQKHYEELLKTKLVLHNKCWKCYYCLIASFGGTCLVFFLNFFLVHTHNWWELTAHFYVLCLFLAHFLVYIEQCGSIIVLARDLRRRTLEAVNTRNVSLIADCSSIWIRLNEVSGLIGFMFYRVYGHLLIIIFSVATFTMYVVLKVNKLSPILWHPIATIIICKSWIFLFCECGERISVELGYKFTLPLLKLRHQMKDDDIRYEVDSFLSAIRDIPPSISLNNYVTVDRRLLITSYSTMVTYLIVVLQFSQEYEPSNNSTNTINITIQDESLWQSVKAYLKEG